MIFYLRLLLISGLISACTHTPVAVSPPVAWGEADHVVQAGNFYIAGQPDRRGLEMARDAGIELVVNLRSPAEMKWDEAAAADELGLQYLNIPFAKTGASIDPETIESLNQMAAANPGRQILLHCSSGNRVSAWYAIYLVQELGYAPEQAMAIAQGTGLTQPELIERVEDYLVRP